MSRTNSVRVGITGGIGAGKSIVSSVFEVLGVAQYDADTRAKWLMNNREDLITAITQLFGARAYNAGGLDRKYVAQSVFKDKLLLGKLNELVHPAVADDFDAWSEKQHAAYLLKEAALLFESDSYRTLDKIITVTAPETLRIARVSKRDGRSKEQIKSIMNHQMSEKEKLEKSDFVITNDGHHLVIPQVLSVHRELLQICG